MNELPEGVNVEHVKPSAQIGKEQPSEFAELMHYAVKKSGDYLEPCCVKTRMELDRSDPRTQGMTVNRGRVNCETCLWMMGNPDMFHPSHEMVYVASDVNNHICGGGHPPQSISRGECGRCGRLVDPSPCLCGSPNHRGLSRSMCPNRMRMDKRDAENHKELFKERGDGNT